LQSDDLRPARYRAIDRSVYPLDGLCHPLAQALFCLFPGQFTAWYTEFEDGDIHAFLRDEGGQVVDLVSYPELLCDDEDYDAGERVHWRPRSPAKRTRTLLARAGLAIKTPAQRVKGKV
jgi:hypothetical protein